MTKNDTSPARIAAAWLVEQAAKAADIARDEKKLTAAVQHDLEVKAAQTINEHARLALLRHQSVVSQVG